VRGGPRSPRIVPSSQLGWPLIFRVNRSSPVEDEAGAVPMIGGEDTRPPRTSGKNLGRFVGKAHKALQLGANRSPAYPG
jgi:hypothetical protein